MHPKNQNKTLYFIIAVLVLIVVGLIIQNQIVLKKAQEQQEQIVEKTTISSDYVVSKLGEQESLAGKQPTYIKQLTKTEIDELLKKYPAIYEGAEPGYFDVRYDDRWIIYDAVNEKIVKDIVVQGMTVG
jgi:hypothetical protein